MVSDDATPAGTAAPTAVKLSDLHKAVPVRVQVADGLLTDGKGITRHDVPPAAPGLERRAADARWGLGTLDRH